MLQERYFEGISFKRLAYTRLQEPTSKVNKALNHITAINITQTNRLIKAGRAQVAQVTELLVLKNTITGNKSESCWKDEFMML